MNKPTQRELLEEGWLRRTASRIMGALGSPIG